MLRSRLLGEIEGIVHGFTDREGGISTDAFESLNLAHRVGDEKATVETNRQKVMAELGRQDAQWVALRQMHGNTIVQINHMAGRSIEADGLWTRDPMAFLSVLVADCVPILIADTGAQAVAAVHAGWRGSKMRIAGKMIERLKSAGFDLSKLRIAMGPAIGPCCYEIGEDVATEISKGVGEAGDAVRCVDGRWVADLWALNRSVLIASGIEPQQIESLRTCTSCTPSLYSYRREGETSGRQAGVIALAAP